MVDAEFKVFVATMIRNWSDVILELTISKAECSSRTLGEPKSFV